MYGAQARAKSKASSKVNKVLDAPGKKLNQKMKQGANKAKAQGKKEVSQKRHSQAKQRPKVEQSTQQPRKDGPRIMSHDSDSDFDPGLKTQAIDIGELVDERAQDCVGWVVCLNGALRGKDFRLVTGRNVLGTAADCDIVLTDPYLSSKHSVIRHENGEFMLIDLDSTNGSYWNDEKISKTELIDNDKIRLGRTELKFKSLF